MATLFVKYGHIHFFLTTVFRASTLQEDRCRFKIYLLLSRSIPISLILVKLIQNSVEIFPILILLGCYATTLSVKKKRQKVTKFWLSD